MAPEPDLVSLALILCAAALATVVSQLSPRLVLPTAAGIASILLYPLLGLLVCRASYTKQEFAGDEA